MTNTFSYQTPFNTEWEQSAKGNWWRQKNGTHMVVGRKTSKDDYWVLVDGTFLKAHYDSLLEAQCAAEDEVR